MRYSTRTAAACLIVAVGAAAAAIAADAPTASERAPAASISPSDHRLTGLVEASRTARLGAPLDGVIASIPVVEDQAVKKDQPLVELDSELQRNQVDAAQMETDRRAMLLQEAQIQLDRITELAKRNAAQEWEVRQATLSRDVAALEVRRAEQAHKQEQAKLARYTIRAPFDGRVLRIESEVGSALRVSEPIVTLVKLDVLEAKLSAPYELYGTLKTGQSYRFQAGAPISRELTGTLKTIDRRIDNAGRTFRAEFTIDNADESLPDGFSVRLIWPQ